MKFEDLISKYLDSELSPSEDKELRDIIADDPLKKQEFNEYVELHYILKKDALDELLNEEDFDNIEDNLLMHILVDQNQTKKRTYAPNYREFLTPVMSIFLVFFISIYTIFDLNFSSDYGLNNGNIRIPNLELSILENETVNINSENFNSISLLNNSNLASNRSDIQNENEFNTNEALVNNIALISETTEDNNILSENNSFSTANVLNNELQNDVFNQEQNDNLDSEFENSFVPSIINTKSSNVSSQFETMENKYLKLDYNQQELKLKDLVFESNLFSELGRGGYSPIDGNKLNSFSQSASIKVTQNSRIGLELGMSEYTFMIQKDITIPYNELSKFDGDLSSARRLPSGVLTKINTKIIYDNYFANVFIDSKLFEHKYFSLNGRTGLGISNGGILITGRLYADIPIFGALHLVSGIDGRVFQNENVFYNQNGIFNTNLSLINGLYFSF
jgi:hypothetical protein